MSTLYLIEQRTILRKTSDRLRLCRFRTPQQRKSHVTQGDILLEIPCADIDHVMLFGNVQVTTQALHELLEHGIELAIFSFRGKLLGQLTPPKPKNILLRVAQFDRYRDDLFKLHIAKAIVKQKINSMLDVLQDYRRNHPDAFPVDQFENLRTIKNRVKNAKDADSLLGFEGAASAIYFRLFGKMINEPWKFTGRNRRPPKDPVNAVLSFAYVIVGAEIQSLLDGAGFDPYLGYYHSTHYGRPSLALDLLEEFRHGFVDLLVLKMFNLKIFSENDFAKHSSGGVFLNTEGKRKFFIHYEKAAGRISGSESAKKDKKKIRQIFQQQVYKMKDAILNNISYVPWNS